MVILTTITVVPLPFLAVAWLPVKMESLTPFPQHENAKIVKFQNLTATIANTKPSSEQFLIWKVITPSEEW